ncbi:MAG: hypothetical protein ACOC95_03640 [Planctomycetota bacterium]
MTGEDAKREDPVENPIEEERSLTDLARHRRRSLASIPVALAMLVIVSLVLWGLSGIIHVPWPLVIIVLGVLVFSFVGDVVNILCINAESRRRRERSIRQRRQKS